MPRLKAGERKLVTWADMPHCSGIMAIEITGVDCDAVQQEITRLMTFVAEHGGICEFRNPYRAGGEWFSRGYIKTETADE